MIRIADHVLPDCISIKASLFCFISFVTEEHIFIMQTRREHSADASCRAWKNKSCFIKNFRLAIVDADAIKPVAGKIAVFIKRNLSALFIIVNKSSAEF